MTLAREKATTWALGQLEAPVLMGYRGDLRFDRGARSLLPNGLGFNVWDCSGFACGSIRAAGGPDLRGTHNAQLLHDGCAELGDTEVARPADLIFYGSVVRGADGVVIKPAHLNIIHVVILLAGGHCISADGATWGITDLETARAAGCRIRLHSNVHFRGDFVTVRRNTWLDELDKVTR